MKNLHSTAFLFSYSDNDVWSHYPVLCMLPMLVFPTYSQRAVPEATKKQSTPVVGQENAHILQVISDGVEEQLV